MAETAERDARAEWPGRTEAAECLGVSISTLRRWERDGRVHPVMLDGTYRFDPAELNRVASGEEQARAEPSAADLLMAAANLLKQAEAHNERLVQLYAEPVRQVHETMRNINTALAARVTEL